MTDVHSPEQRSRNMASIRGKDTKPEKLVRSLLHKLGYRYRLHRKDLPGKPDLVFPSRRKVIFVHGCFWHMHNCRWGKVTPSTNAEFWHTKRKGNSDRDNRAMKGLAAQGWDVYIIWECEIKDQPALAKRIASFLGDRK
jgi:DNA mismatch endonuclease (patch repair protein)